MVRKGYLNGQSRGGEHRGRDEFVEVSWESALQLVAREIQSVRAEHGNRAIFGGSYGWSSAGRVNHARTLLHRFLNCAGGFVDQQQNYSWAAAAVLLPHVTGGLEAVAGPVTDWRSIIAQTRLMVMFGGAALKNGRVTAGGAGEHAYTERLRAAKAAGVRFVVISPNQDDAPDFLEAEFIPIRPNTDTAMMLGLAHVLLTEQRHDEAFLEKCTVGFERYEKYVLGETDGTAKTPDWAAGITGVPAETIRRLAIELVSQRSMLTATWSLQRADRGEHVYWTLIALAAMVGQVGLPGGGFGFGYGSINGMGGSFPPTRGPFMESGRNPVGLAIPVARISDLLLGVEGGLRYNGQTLDLPDIKLVYWAGGNPFHHHQDTNRLLRAWQKPETIIVNEIWWTATARHADIVLPATTTLERPDISSAPRDRFLFPMQQAIAPLAKARNDYDIFADLAELLDVRQVFTEGRGIEDWARKLYAGARERARAGDIDLPSYEEFQQAGYAEYPVTAQPFVLFEKFRRDPAAHPLKTPSGKLEIYSETIAGFGEQTQLGMPEWRPPREWLGSDLAKRFPLHLISTQPATRLHGQLDPEPVSMGAKINSREPIWLNPVDASVRKIQQGDIVRVFNDRGACLAGAIVTAQMSAGVVRMSTGAWFDPIQPGDIGSLDKHGNPNVLSHDYGCSEFTQGPAPQSTLVQLERYDEPPPPVTCFDPPAIALQHA